MNVLSCGRFSSNGYTLTSAIRLRSYTALWRFVLKEFDAFFRISLADEPFPQIPTRFTRESFTLGAYLGSELMGSVSIERDNRVKLNHKALLFRMFVHPDAAGQGIGKSLVSEAISHAESMQGLRQVHLTVLYTNDRAKRIYTSLGFKEFSREPQSVKINELYVDELQMVRFVKSGGHI